MADQHTQKFIGEMKKLLASEKKQLEQELGHSDQFPEYGRNEEDNATEIVDYQRVAATSNALGERLKAVEMALERIDRGSYGQTDQGELIPEKRLRANPAATTIIK